MPWLLVLTEAEREASPVPVKLEAAQNRYSSSPSALSSPVPHENISSRVVPSSPEHQRQGLQSQTLSANGKHFPVFPGEPVPVQSRLKA